MKTKIPLRILCTMLFALIGLNSYGQVQIGPDIDGEATGDLSGDEVSLSADGTTVAIGAWANDENGTFSGHVRIYKKNDNDTWGQVGDDIDGEAADDKSATGLSLSADGTTVAIGANGNDENGGSSGHVRIYTYDNDNGTWIQVGDDIDGEAAGDYSGSNVSLSPDGTTVAIGAWGNNNDNGGDSGHVRIYTYDNDNGTWIQVGDDIDGEAAGDQSGWSVSLSEDGTTVAIGATGNSNGTYSGHVRIYEYNEDDDAWGQVGNDIDGEAAGDSSGTSVSLSDDGTTVAIGAPGNDENGSSSGHVRIYEYDSDNSAWIQVGNDIDGEAAGDQSGWSVSLSADGTTVAIGAWKNDENGSNSGHVRIYTNDNKNSAWIQVGDDIHGEAANNTLGYSVSLSEDGTTVAIGAPQNVIPFIGSGHVRVFDVSTSEVSIGAPASTQEAFGVIFSFDRAVTDFTQEDVVLMGATISNFTVVDNLEYTALITPTSSLCDPDITITVPVGAVRNASSEIPNITEVQVSVVSDINRFTDSDIQYEIMDCTAATIAAVDYTGTESNLIIPATVVHNGTTYTVTSIGDQAFTDNLITQIITLGITPPSLGTNAFDNRDQIDVIVPIGSPAGTIKIAYENEWGSAIFQSITEGIGVSIDTETAIGNLTPFEVTITFNENVTGFTQEDIAGNILNATVVDGSFYTVNGSTYTVMLEPTSFQDAIIIDVPANVAVYTGAAGLANAAATKVSVMVNGLTPIAKDITVQLDANGAVTITPEDVDNGSGGNSAVTLSFEEGATEMVLSCADVGGPVAVALIVSDGVNSTQTFALVTVQDNINPIVMTQDITIQLDTDGHATITAQDIDNGSFDTCSGIASMALDITTFDCPELGGHTLILTVTDTDGNQATGAATVTLEATDTNNNLVPDTCEFVVLAAKGFSPNGDGIGDTWTIIDIEDYPNNNVQVFNQWGEVVFQASPYQNDWDGISNRTGGSKRLPVAPYLYIINPNQEGIEPITGWIYLNY